MTEWNRGYWWRMWCPLCGDPGEALDRPCWSIQGSDGRGGGEEDPYTFLVAHAIIHMRDDHGESRDAALNQLAAVGETHWETVDLNTGEVREAGPAPALLDDSAVDRLVAHINRDGVHGGRRRCKSAGRTGVTDDDR